MENVSKALEIAAGTLLAVMVMAIVVWFFSSISSMPQEQDNIETAEQLAKFNLEYEVYDKSAMYGVDVISCLNKALSNNKTYAEGGPFLVGGKYGDDFYIQVKVKIKNALEESIEVYHYDNTNKLVQSFDENISDENGVAIKMGDVGFVFRDSNYTNFNTDTTIGNKVESLDGARGLPVGSYSDLYNNSHPTSETSLYNILKFSGDYMKQTVRNTTGKDLDKWATATWSTALYNLKTKKFKCDYIEYSNKTGRVKEIAFSEI